MRVDPLAGCEAGDRAGMKLAPGSLAKLDGQSVTVIAQTDTRTYYIPGFHYWGCAKTDRFEPVDRTLF